MEYLDIVCLLYYILFNSIPFTWIFRPACVYVYSAGIGRTGTMIAIDRLIEEGIDKGSVNVFECVKKMREQRVNMVQTHVSRLISKCTTDCFIYKS